MTRISPKIESAILDWFGAVRLRVWAGKKTGRRGVELKFIDPVSGKPYYHKTHYARIKYAAMHKVHIPDHLEVDHEDGDRANDRLSNLRLLTKSENIKEAHRLGIMTDNKGENNPRAKLSSKTVTKLRKLYAESNLTPAECAIKLGLDIKKAQISSTLHGVSWSEQDRTLIKKCVDKINSDVSKSMHSGKLKSEDVLKLREYRHKTGKTLEACIAKLKLPITVGNAWAIVKGRSWKSTGGPIEP